MDKSFKNKPFHFLRFGSCGFGGSWEKTGHEYLKRRIPYLIDGFSTFHSKQGCQMLSFQTKIHNLGIFLGEPWNRKFCYIFWSLGIFKTYIFYGHLVIF
jgi:hypothetical protein